MKGGNDSLGAMNVLKAIEMDSTKVDILGEVAKIFYDKKDYGKAVFYYDYKIKKSAKPIIQDIFYLGRAYYFDSAFVLADSSFKKVTEMSPTWPTGYFWRARSNPSVVESM